MQTLDDCNMREYIPESTSDGLREILLGCLAHSPREYLHLMNELYHLFESFFLHLFHFISYIKDKRIPASILLSSPWFDFHEIYNVDDASSLMMVYLDSAYPPYNESGKEDEERS